MEEVAGWLSVLEHQLLKNEHRKPHLSVQVYKCISATFICCFHVSLEQIVLERNCSNTGNMLNAQVCCRD